jgi:hypothetical protein
MNFRKENAAMNILAIGQPFDETVQHWPEGTMFNYSATGAWLIYFYSAPSRMEISSIQEGPAEFGLYMAGPVLFLLHKFHPMPWNDAAYSVWLVHEDERVLPEISDHLHALLRVVLVDTSTGLVAALRACTFSAQFTKTLHQAIHFQASLPWNPSLHERIIREVYATQSTDDMVRQCKLFCKGGD